MKKMHYEPCMFTVQIDGRMTYLVVHTDGIDGAAEDPRDGVAIVEALDKRFGVTVGDPKFMLGVLRYLRARTAHSQLSSTILVLEY